jgi:hypothetical protein
VATSAELTLAFVARNDLFTISAGQGSSLFNLSGDNTAGRIQGHTPWSDGAVYFDVGGPSGAFRVTAPSGLTQSIAFQASFLNSVSQNTQSVWTNGTLRASDSTGHSFGVVRFGLGFMVGAGGVNQSIYNGAISEGFLFPSALSTINRQALENNQKTYFGTP